MQLNHALAKQIVDKAHAILKRDIALTDLSGQLLATNAGIKRPFVAEALSVAQTGEAVTAMFEGNPTRWSPFVYEGRTIAVFGLPDNSTESVAGEAMTLLEGLSEVIVYQHFLLDKIQSTERVRADFIRQALTAPSVDVEDIYRQADILQLGLRSPMAAILAQVDSVEASVGAQFSHLAAEERQLKLDSETGNIADVIRACFGPAQDNLVAYLGNDRFVILKSINGENLTTLNTIRYLSEKGDQVLDALQKMQQHYGVTVGVGQYYPDLRGLRKSYGDAKLALDVGSRVWGIGHSYHIKRVGMFITLAGTSQDRKAELAHQILSPLLKDEQLFKTVQAFLASGLNLTEAAEQLHIHRNTLIYRLDKTKKLIGLDPRHFDDALQIKLGLMFYQEVAN